MTYYSLDVKDGLVSVVHDYDYSEYDRTNYLCNPEEPGYILRFDTEREAQKYLNEKIKIEHIHPEWVNQDLNQAKLFK